MRKISWFRRTVDRFVHGSRAALTISPLLSHAYRLVFEIQGNGIKVPSRAILNPSFEDIRPSEDALRESHWEEKGAASRLMDVA
jgi:hypothetical protein